MKKDVHHITLYNTVARDHQHSSLKKRLYLHLDMNCFYAQVEQRDRNLYGFPVAIGGWKKPDGTPRGIVATSSYEARKLGIETAMSAYEAWEICPYVVFLQVDYEKYTGVSRQLKNIMESFAPDVEKYSMDEYFMDITFLLGKSRNELRQFSRRLKAVIYEKLGLVCSVGIATSKTWSKLASGLKKPDGLMLILNPDDAAEHLFQLPLNKVWGIGSRRYEKLRQEGLHTIADAFQRGPGIFRRLFGGMQGQLFYEIVTGRDKAKVLLNDHHVPDEVSYMHTFSDWSVDVEQIRGEVVRAVRNVCYRLRGYHRKSRKWSCYVRFQGSKWEGETVIFITDGYTNLDDYVLRQGLPGIMHLVRRALGEGDKIRGIGLNTVDMVYCNQLELFFEEGNELQSLYRASDLLNNMYGAGTVEKATSKNGVPGRTHFVSRS